MRLRRLVVVALIGGAGVAACGGGGDSPDPLPSISAPHALATTAVQPNPAPSSYQTGPVLVQTIRFDPHRVVRVYCELDDPTNEGTSGLGDRYYYANRDPRPIKIVPDGCNPSTPERPRG